MSSRTGHSHLKQKLGQKLTARQIQLMNMISLPCTELEQRVKQELEENPALEEGVAESEAFGESTEQQEGKITEEELVLGDYATPEDVPDFRLRSTPDHVSAGGEIPFSEDPSLIETLRTQLGYVTHTPDERKLGEFIIGSLDEDGYLRRPLEGLLDDLAIYYNIETTIQKLQDVLDRIRTLDPPGVGAHDLRDCLSLQLHRRKSTPETLLARRIIDDHFDLFSKKSYDRLGAALGVSEAQLRSAITLIGKLNPAPGTDFSSRLEESLHTIIPDFYIEEQDGELVVTLNQADTPPIRINREFTHSMKAYTGDMRSMPPSKRDTARFVKGKIEEAHWFVDMLRQRNETLIRTMTAIVARQKDFFISGDSQLLKPMILKDIADLTGYDPSTISRVTSTKYVQTHFGIFSLKYLFSEGTTTATGQEVSTRHVKELIQELIETEDKRRPLSDDALSAHLRKHGYTIARRTVAKYRDQLGISIARLRKEI